MSIPAGGPVPLALQLPVDDDTVFVRATVLNSSNSAVTGSPFSLSYMGQGKYASSALLMPNVPWIKAIYEVFNNSGFTVPSGIYGNADDIFYLQPINDNSNPLQSPRLVGKLFSLQNEKFTPCANYFQLDQGEDVVFNLQLMNGDNGVPLDLSAVSAAVAKFLNADSSMLTLTLSGGVALLTPNLLGMVQVTLSSAQTALLQSGKQSFEITFTISGLTNIVRFPYGLQVNPSVFS